MGIFLLIIEGGEKVVYADLYNKLEKETAIVTFLKKDGTTRVMLCTRNTLTAGFEYGYLGGLLSGHDRRCNTSNGNLATIDLVIGECRAFNISRVLDIEWLGVIEDPKLLEEAYEEYRSIKDEKQKLTINMDNV